MTPSTLPTGGPTLTGDQLETLRCMLHQQRSFRLDQLQQLRRTEEFGAAADVDREITASLAAGARSALRDVLLALRRMDEGTYGTCRECAAAIAPARLEILPQVTLCMSCQRASEGG